MIATHSPPLQHTWDGNSHVARSHFTWPVLPSAAAATPETTLGYIWVTLINTPAPLSAAQKAVRARTAVFQNEVCVWHWHMVKIHLAGARVCSNRNTCAAEGVFCGCHSMCVSGWAALLRGSATTCGQLAVVIMLQQLICRHRQQRLCAACARAVARVPASDACDGHVLRAACAAIA